MKSYVPAENAVQTIAANVHNEKLSDKEFRQFVENTLGIVKEAEPYLNNKSNKNIHGSVAEQ